MGTPGGGGVGAVQVLHVLTMLLTKVVMLVLRKLFSEQPQPLALRQQTVPFLNLKRLRELAVVLRLQPWKLFVACFLLPLSLVAVLLRLLWQQTVGDLMPLSQ